MRLEIVARGRILLSSVTGKDRKVVFFFKPKDRPLYLCHLSGPGLLHRADQNYSYAGFLERMQMMIKKTLL